MRRILVLSLLAILVVTGGCTCDTNEPPTAYIDLISPTEVSPGEAVTFEGHGTDADGTVVAYRWESSIDGDLSTRASFDSSSLSEGEHTIRLKVQDNNGTWSEEVESTVIVSGGAAGVPVITSFSASPGSISPGGSSTLSWDVSGATTVSLDQGIGSVPLSGSRAVSPGATTTYTPTATNAAGSVTATAAVSVSGGAAGVPVISYFTADPETVPPGGPSTLSWSVSNADTVTISSGTESLLVGPVGTATASPATTTTYTLTATNAAGGVTRTARVSVGAGGAAGLPVINSFTANPGTITAGETSQLSWDVSNADTVMYAWNGAKSATSLVGTAEATPDTTTIYTLTATNAAGSVTATVQVVVGAAPPEEHTAIRPLVKPESGVLTSPHGGPAGTSVDSAEGGLCAGDGESNEIFWAYFSFDISDLADVEVTNATLSFSTIGVWSTPFDNLGSLGIYAYHWGPRAITADDFHFLGPTLVDGLEGPPGEIDVTDTVVALTADGADRFQVRANFLLMTDGDNDTQAILWSGATLTVTYLE